MRSFAYSSSRQPTPIRRDLLHFLTHWFTSYKSLETMHRQELELRGTVLGQGHSLSSSSWLRLLALGSPAIPGANLRKISVMMTSRLLRDPHMIERIILQGSHQKMEGTITQEKIMAALSQRDNAVFDLRLPATRIEPPSHDLPPQNLWLTDYTYCSNRAGDTVARLNGRIVNGESLATYHCIGC